MTDSSASETELAKKEARREAGVVDNRWRALRAFTDARIGLGRAGISLPTHRLLEFQLAHAQARDAVHLPLDIDTLCDDLAAVDTTYRSGDAPIRLHSRAADRTLYLQRPDYGRRLDDASLERLKASRVDETCDLALVVVDGLSSHAVQSHAPAFVDAVHHELASDTTFEWRFAPLSVVEQGRVAIGDEIGAVLGADLVAVLIGERPGLSSPDSLGLYLTWGPHVGVTDADRNCISNVRPAGLDIAEGARRLLYLMREARERQLTGVHLKDRSEEAVIDHDDDRRNFLTD